MMPTVVDTILHAMAGAFPDRVAAAHHGIYGVHTVFGKNPETGERFHNLDTVTGGWGGSARSDGPGPFRSAAHGDVPDIPVEMQEALFPYRIEAKQIRTRLGGSRPPSRRHRRGEALSLSLAMLGGDEVRSRR